MTTTLSPPVRLFALVGVLAAIAVGLLLYTQTRTSSASPAAAGATPTLGGSHSRLGSSATHRIHSTSTEPVRTTPRIRLLPGLPGPVAHALRYSKVVVVSLYTAGGSGDRAALQQARAGAASAHAGFAAVNVLNERFAVGLDKFAGATSSPAVLVVRRPGRIVNRFGGYADKVLVAQAAQNAGAGSSR